MLNILVILSIALLTSCQSAHTSSASQDALQKETVATQNKIIRVGMPPQEVHVELGIPNIVTKDAYGKDAWIYDQYAYDIGYEPEGDGIWVLSSKKVGLAHEVNPNDLTIVIKFSDAGFVDDVTYHSFEY